MATIRHIFERHQRFQNGRLVSDDYVARQANLEYDMTGSTVIISIIPTLSPKKAYLVRQVGFTLYYRGEDTDYRFEVECWPDNGTIKRLSVFRDDMSVEIRYLSNHQDAM